ncbi:MAG: hypothetical protein K9L56_14100, partial [Clostridiales bacterium]|nr:hypothetical protein [Clostridiales bacterium]
MYIDEPNYFNYSERLEYKILLKKPFGEVVGVVKESYNKNFNLNMIGVNDFTFRLSASSEYADDIKVNKHLRVQIIHPEKIDDRDNVIDNPIFYEEEMVITDITKLDTDKKTIQVTAKSISLNLGKRIIENYQSEAAKIF